MHWVAWLIVVMAVALVLALSEPLLYPNARAAYERRHRAELAERATDKRRY